MFDSISLHRLSNMLSFYTFHHFKLEIVIGAAAKAAIVSFNPGSTLATVPTVRELLQSYARTTESGEFAFVTEGWLLATVLSDFSSSLHSPQLPPPLLLVPLPRGASSRPIRPTPSRSQDLSTPLLFTLFGLAPDF